MSAATYHARCAAVHSGQCGTHVTAAVCCVDQAAECRAVSRDKPSHVHVAGHEACPALTWLGAEQHDPRGDAQHLSASWTARREPSPPREAVRWARVTSAEPHASGRGAAAHDDSAREHRADRSQAEYYSGEPASPAADDLRGRPYATDTSLQVSHRLSKLKSLQST